VFKYNQQIRKKKTKKQNVPATITNILLFAQDVQLDQNDTLEHEPTLFQT